MRWATPLRRPRLVHTSRRARAGPKGSSTNPQDPPRSRHGRGPGIPFQAESNRLRVAFSCRHIVLLPVAGSARCHSGMLQAERRGSSARSTTRPYSYPVRWPATADPATMMPDSGRCDVPGGGTHLRKRCRGLPANHASLRSHALPGFPGSPVGPPGCSGVSFPSSQARDRTAPSGTSPAVA